jgi:hypothetical protein
MASEDGLAFISPAGDLIISSGILNPQVPGHFQFFLVFFGLLYPIPDILSNVANFIFLQAA